MNLQERGSLTAKNGFQNERDIVAKFKDWENQEVAQRWLIALGYDINEIEWVNAEIISGYKTDVQVQVIVKLKKVIDVQNIQVKLVSLGAGFNQVDKRWVDNYKELWDIPEDIVKLLKYYTGETLPYKENTLDSRRMNLNEFTPEERRKFIDWFDANKFLVFTDVFRGRGEFAAEWIMVIHKFNGTVNWVIKNINDVLNHLNGPVTVSNRGVLYIGTNLTMQRKGGDNGRDTAKMLQFKSNPLKLFDY